MLVSNVFTNLMYLQRVIQSHSDLLSFLFRSFWVRCSVLLYLLALVVWYQYCPDHHDWGLHCSTWGQSVIFYKNVCRHTAYHVWIISLTLKYAFVFLLSCVLTIKCFLLLSNFGECIILFKEISLVYFICQYNFASQTDR